MHATKHFVNTGILLLLHYPTNLGNGAIFTRYMDRHAIQARVSFLMMTEIKIRTQL
jgi:hypothetical protein